MAAILVLAHEFDEFGQANYLIKGCFAPWQQIGHSVHVSNGIPATADADVVVLLTDLSVVPQEYLDFAARFSAGANRTPAGAATISTYQSEQATKLAFGINSFLSPANAGRR